MAKSPEKNAATSEVLRYDLGWDAINAMLRAGRSLSGHERNCCFLNSKGKRFADISGVAGLDLDDDGRVLALADWDYDGDVDFWIANRSGPQLRYLENRISENGFIAIRLEGVSCNRDAIGARVELTCEVDGTETKQFATMRAGQGYLAQNSKWIHFGLGESGRIESLTITWPGGETQTIGSLEPNRFYKIREGDAPVNWLPPTNGGFRELAVKEFKAPPVSDAARIVLLNPIPLPPLAYSESTTVETSKRAKLVNLWATWCQPCLKELAEWKSHADDFASLELEVIAINVDEPAEDREAKTKQVTDSLGLPFQTILGDQKLVEQFDVLQRSLLSRQRPLPVPSSFLIDGDGRLCVVYKGPVDAETVLADAKLIDAPREEILAAATPFDGKWLNPPSGSTTLHLAVKYLEGGFVSEVQAYIESLIAQRDSHPEYLSASMLNLYGATMLDQKEYRKAETAFRESLKLDNANRQAHIELGSILLRSKRGEQAVPHFETVLQVNATDPELQFKLGLAHLAGRDVEKAEDSFERSIELRPNPSALWQLADLQLATGAADGVPKAIANYESAIKLNSGLVMQANNLAWLLSTHEDEALRNGSRALEIATEICAGDNVSASSMDTLAAALAETGDFAGATKAAERAVAKATLVGNHGLAKRIEARKSLYLQRQAFRDSR